MSGWDQFTTEADSQAVVTNSNEAKPGKDCKGSGSCLKQLMTSKVGGCATKVNEVLLANQIVSICRFQYRLHRSR